MSALLIAVLGLALVGGLLARLVKLPALVGFLGAGYALVALGVQPEPSISQLGSLGVTALLFTIGLKLNLRALATPEVLGVGVAHMALWTVVLAGILMALASTGWAVLADFSWSTALIVGLALSFSSTVFAVKLLESRDQQESRYGGIAVGLLVVQDIVAVGFITATADAPPSPWAALLLGLPLLYWPIRHMLGRIGHGELLVLAGLVLAFGSFFVFDAVGVKGDLGALLIGVLVARTPQAREMYSRLSSIKELLLIAFFVDVGLYGLLSLDRQGLALIFLALLPLKAVLFLGLFRLFGNSARVNAMASAVLTNYSEFGLVVATVAVGAGWLDKQWVAMLAIAVTGSFVGSSMVFGVGSELLEWVVKVTRSASDAKEHAVLEEKPTDYDLSLAQAVVLGMGRVGRGAYRQLHEVHGLLVVGIDSNVGRVNSLRGRGAQVIEADAADPDLWRAIEEAPDLRFVVCTMPIQEDHMNDPLFHKFSRHRYGKTKANGQERTYRIVVSTRYPDQRETLLETGVSDVVYVYQGAGAEVADLAANSIMQEDDETSRFD